MSSWQRAFCLFGFFSLVLLGMACASKGNLEETNIQVTALRDRIEALTVEVESTQRSLVIAKDDLADAKKELTSTVTSLDSLRNTSLQEMDSLHVAQGHDLKFQKLITLFGLTNILSLAFTEEGFAKTQDAIEAIIVPMDDSDLLAKWNAVAPLAFGTGPNSALDWDAFLGALRERLADAQS